MSKMSSYFVLSVLLFFCAIPVFAGNYGSDFSANPDPSYDSSYSTNTYPSYKAPSSYRKSTFTPSSSRTFSGGVMTSKGGHSYRSYNPQNNPTTNTNSSTSTSTSTYKGGTYR